MFAYTLHDEEALTGSLDLLSLHQCWLAILHCDYRDGEMDRLLERLSPVFMYVRYWHHCLDSGQEILRCPPTKGQRYPQCFQGPVDRYYEQRKYG